MDIIKICEETAFICKKLAIIKQKWISELWKGKNERNKKKNQKLKCSCSKENAADLPQGEKAFTQGLSAAALYKSRRSDSAGTKRPGGTGHDVGGSQNTAGTCCVGFQLTRKKSHFESQTLLSVPT